MPVGRGARQAASTQCTPLHSTLAAAPTFNPASLTKAVLKVSPLLTMSLPLFPRLVFGQSHGRPVFPLTLRLTDNFKIWIVAKSYSFTSFSFFSEILQVYPFFFFFLGALCIALLNFIQDSNSSQTFCSIVLLLSSPSAKRAGPSGLRALGLLLADGGGGTLFGMSIGFFSCPGQLDR